MRTPNERNRLAILRAAGRAFARRPFHEVRLQDVARLAKVGKGTIYVYFRSKEHLYAGLVSQAMDELLEDLRLLAARAEAAPARDLWPIVEQCVQLVSDWTSRHPNIFDMMRSGVIRDQAHTMHVHRGEMGRLLERILERAAQLGVTRDPCPQLTANFIPSMARAGVVWTSGIDGRQLKEHILRLLERGVRAGRKRR